MPRCRMIYFFFNDTATTEIYPLSHTTLFRSGDGPRRRARLARGGAGARRLALHRGVHRLADVLRDVRRREGRSEEHTSELQSRQYLVCRLLLEKKKKKEKQQYSTSVHECED